MIGATRQNSFFSFLFASYFFLAATSDRELSTLNNANHLSTNKHILDSSRSSLSKLRQGKKNKARTQSSIALNDRRIQLEDL